MFKDPKRLVEDFLGAYHEDLAERAMFNSFGLACLRVPVILLCSGHLCIGLAPCWLRYSHGVLRAVRA